MFLEEESFAQRHRVYSPPEVDRIWGIRGSHYNIPRV